MRPHKPIQMVLISIALVLAAGQVPAGHYAEHTPGRPLLLEGQRSYQAGYFGRAMSKFHNAALWADKLAQYNLGVMHYHGQGTEQDLAKAWAWFQLAAERNYPQMVHAAEQVWSQLDSRQRVQARRILEEELEPRFGDQVAVPRTARLMDRERRRATGSRLGSTSYPMSVWRADGTWIDGSQFYAKEKWDFHQVMAQEAQVFDALARGRVELREVEGDEEQDSP